MHHQISHHKKSNYEYLSIAALILLGASLLILSYSETHLFGSSCDWYTQYISLAETMREAVYEAGTIFITRLPLGGGMNIYDFAYYGYLRPDILIGCLLPAVSMEMIINIYMIAGYLISIILCYRLLKRMHVRPAFCFLGTLLFLSSACFFHLHRQIVFINYMPYLLGALLGILHYHKTGHRKWLILMLFLIEMHSFYYAISCLFVIYLFLLYSSGKGHSIAKLFRLTKDYCLAALCSVLMAGILLLPTAASILNCAAARAVDTVSINPLKLQGSFSSLLYNPYGLGLTLFCLLFLLVSLSVRRYYLMGALILFACGCGIIPYILNGFLYARGKILIPFLPIIIVLVMETFQILWYRRRQPHVLLLIPIFAVTYLQYRQEGERYICWDLAVILFIYILFYLRSRRVRLPLPAVVAVCGGLTFCFAAVVHTRVDFLERKHTQTSSFSQKTLEFFYTDSSYRFDSMLEPFQTANQLTLWGAGRSTMYTSTYSPLYNSFYFDIMKNPIRINNRVSLLSEANPFFLYFMGVRYLESKETKVPYGYEIKQSNETSVLAESQDALPLVYGSTTLLSESSFDQLVFPDTFEALTSTSIVPEASADSEDTFASHMQELTPAEGTDYTIEKKSDTRFTITPASPIEDQILILTFQVKRTGKKAVSIEINQIKNKLSGASAPYPNHNNQFTFILSSPDAMDSFKVRTEGEFEISDLHLYSFDTSHFGMETIYDFTAGETSGTEIVNGTTTLPEDGYLITSYPMQDGYRAYVDGEPYEVETVNKAFVGIPLGKGTHSIQIHYSPPFRTTGGVLSLIGLGCYVIIIYWERKRRVTHG